MDCGSIHPVRIKIMTKQYEHPYVNVSDVSVVDIENSTGVGITVDLDPAPSILVLSNAVNAGITVNLPLSENCPGTVVKIIRLNASLNSTVFNPSPGDQVRDAAGTSRFLSAQWQDVTVISNGRGEWYTVSKAV